MITLEKIRDVAIEYKACEDELNPFINSLESGDITKCWQIVLGNIRWLKNTPLEKELNQIEIEYLAENTSLTHYSNGSICEKIRIVDGVYDGGYYRYNDNGNVSIHGSYIDGKPHGTFTLYYYNGMEQGRVEYNNGILIEDDKNGTI